MSPTGTADTAVAGISLKKLLAFEDKLSHMLANRFEDALASEASDEMLVGALERSLERAIHAARVIVADRYGMAEEE
ncbi:MAG TPA: hypothetical protein VFL91_21250 [Thermomicrobiales bacterium]|nr:hypothetical protein [Thermomicrobiales bacterium]